MRKRGVLKEFLSRKLILAFILVAVPPMLIASNVATDLVNSTVNHNMENWLRKTSQYIMTTFRESENALRAVHTLLHSRFAQEHLSFDPDDLEALSDLDADVFVLRDAAGKTILASPPAVRIEQEPLFHGSNLKWVVMENGSRELAIVIGTEIQAWDGSRRSLELGSLLVFQLSETKQTEPVSVRLFLPEASSFRQVYSSMDGPLTEIPHGALAQVMSGSGEVFIPDRDWTDNTPNAHLLLKGLLDSRGKVAAVFALSVHMQAYNGWWPSSRQLFGGIFLAGILLAGGTGYFLTKRIVRPIKLLNEGVKAITAGNLEYRIAVKGKDEIAELSSGFNLMSRQLEIMRREGQESAKRDRSRMLGEIALGFAHEIRNPLVVIKTSAELVHTKLPKKGKDARLMGFVVEEVGRIDSLVRQFLAFATPEPISFKPLQLQQLVEGVLAISAAEFEKHSIHCSLAVETTDSSVLGEPNQIRQVLLNLLMNAKDAMPEGGQVWVRLYDSADNTRICIDVRDEGAGIPRDVLPNIYLPFVSTKKNGLGLGLAKAQAIIEAHGGTITCSGRPDEGTVFSVYLNKCSG